jgi:argininosuccinate lyase
VAELLGFKGLVVHTRDAMWQSDGPIELMSATQAILCNIDRLAEDLQIWATSEFNFIDLSESHSRISVIMPQKKNPYSLAYTRGVAREMIGRLSATAALQMTPSGQVDNRIFTYGMVPKGLMQTKEALKLFSATISGLKINKDEMRLAAVESLVGATDLAEEIMMRYGINAQAAHSIVGQAIRCSTQEGKRLNADLINDAAKDIINCSLNISDSYIAQIMDPEAIIETRTGLGGASSKSVHTMITDLRSEINDCNHWMTLEKSWLIESEKKLIKRVESICQCT